MNTSWNSRYFDRRDLSKGGTDTVANTATAVESELAHSIAADGSRRCASVRDEDSTCFSNLLNSRGIRPVAASVTKHDRPLQG